MEKYGSQWNPQEERKIERPREKWRRSVNKELGRVGKTCCEVRRISTERMKWNSFVAALYCIERGGLWATFFRSILLPGI